VPSGVPEPKPGGHPPRRAAHRRNGAPLIAVSTPSRSRFTHATRPIALDQRPDAFITEMMSACRPSTSKPVFNQLEASSRDTSRSHPRDEGNNPEGRRTVPPHTEPGLPPALPTRRPAWHEAAQPSGREHGRTAKTNRASHDALRRGTCKHALRRWLATNKSRTPAMRFDAFQRSQMTGSLRAGLPHRHHPLSGFLTLSAV
jgi:hypothetical protein